MPITPPQAGSELEVEPEVEVRRSARRRRTVSAYQDGDRVVVLIPAGFTRAQEREWVDTMVTRITRQMRRRRPSDADLSSRAAELSARYLDGRACPSSVAWVENQNSRWGSCSTAQGTIRLSSRLRGMPQWVIDYVLLHELAHLIESNHSARFWALLAAYPRTERARGYLEGHVAGARSGSGDQGLPDDDADDADCEADEAAIA